MKIDGKKLKKLLREKGYSNTKVAELLAVQKATVSNWIGRGTLNDYHLEKICEVLRIDADDIKLKPTQWHELRNEFCDELENASTKKELYKITEEVFNHCQNDKTNSNICFDLTIIHLLKKYVMYLLCETKIEYKYNEYLCRYLDEIRHIEPKNKPYDVINSETLRANSIINNRILDKALDYFYEENLHELIVELVKKEYEEFEKVMNNPEEYYEYDDYIEGFIPDEDSFGEDEAWKQMEEIQYEEFPGERNFLVETLISSLITGNHFLMYEDTRRIIKNTKSHIYDTWLQIESELDFNDLNYLMANNPEFKIKFDIYKKYIVHTIMKLAYCDYSGQPY